MRISLGDVSLWFDVSGPSVISQGDTTVERPTLVVVHGGPGLDHIIVRARLAPLAEHVQVVFYDQRGHGRSDHSTAEDSDRSRIPSASCVSPIAGPGARSAQPRISSLPRARHPHNA